MLDHPEPHGHAALLLCESLMITLVENGVITRENARDTVEHVVNVKRDGVVVSMVSIGLLRGIERSLAAAAILPSERS